MERTAESAFVALVVPGVLARSAVAVVPVVHLRAAGQVACAHAHAQRSRATETEVMVGAQSPSPSHDGSQL